MLHRINNLLLVLKHWQILTSAFHLWINRLGNFTLSQILTDLIQSQLKIIGVGKFIAYTYKCPRLLVNVCCTPWIPKNHFLQKRNKKSIFYQFCIGGLHEIIPAGNGSDLGNWSNFWSINKDRGFSLVAIWKSEQGVIPFSSKKALIRKTMLSSTLTLISGS